MRLEPQSSENLVFSRPVYSFASPWLLPLAANEDHVRAQMFP